MTEADTDSPDTPVDDGDSLGFDAPDGADVTVVTQGDPIRSFCGALDAALSIDDARFQFTDDGLTVRAVDPANIAMADLTFPADGFSAYRADGVTVGMPLTTARGGDLLTALAYARKGHQGQDGDPVRIDIFDGTPTRIRIAILRPDQQTKRVTEFFAVDPDSIRQDPDLPDVSWSYRADPSVDALTDAVASLDTHDHVWFGGDGRTFVIGSQPTQNPTLSADDRITDVIEFPNRAWAVDDPDGLIDDADGSLFSLDYLADFASALTAAKASTLTIKFDDEYPGVIDFQNTDWGVRGTFMVAPRIQSD